MIVAGLIGLMAIGFCVEELPELLREKRVRRAELERERVRAYAKMVNDRPSTALAVAIESHWTAVRSAGMACDCEACKLDPSEVRAMGELPPPSPEPDVGRMKAIDLRGRRPEAWPWSR